MSRGDRREDLFRDDVDRQDLLKTPAEAGQKTGFQVHTYCLMGNHFRRVVQTPEANWVAGMRWLLSTYTIRLNPRHKLCGHVFSGRYKALLVEGGGGGGYLKTVCDHVHLNPVRAKLLGREDRLLGYPSDPGKLALAERLRRETTLTVGWIAQRLPLGTRNSAAVKLHRWGDTGQRVQLDPIKTMV
jgi:REP element-mobilizing transposase RayT